MGESGYDGQRDRQRQQCESGLAEHVVPPLNDLEAERYELGPGVDCCCNRIAYVDRFRFYVRVHDEAGTRKHIQQTAR